MNRRKLVRHTNHAQMLTFRWTIKREAERVLALTFASFYRMPNRAALLTSDGIIEYPGGHNLIENFTYESTV